MDPGDDVYLEDRTAVVQDSEDPPGNRGLGAERALGVILMPGTAQAGPVEEPLSLSSSARATLSLRQVAIISSSASHLAVHNLKKSQGRLRKERPRLG